MDKWEYRTVKFQTGGFFGGKLDDGKGGTE